MWSAQLTEQKKVRALSKKAQLLNQAFHFSQKLRALVKKNRSRKKYDETQILALDFIVSDGLSI